MPPVIQRGKPLREASFAEAVKGSYEHLRDSIRSAFYRQFGDYDEVNGGWFYVCETFADHVIVEASKLPNGEFYKVNYTYDVQQRTFVFVSRDEWQLVQLAYQPVTFLEKRDAYKDKGKRLVEVTLGAVSLAEASSSNKPRVIKGVGAYADQINQNGRRYSKAVLREAVQEARTHLHESLSQGRAILPGESEHPGDRGQKANLLNTIVAWKELRLNEETGQLELEGQMVESTQGRDAVAVMEAGVFPGLSLRGYGESEIVKEGKQKVEEVKWLRLTGFDLVLDPSFETAGINALESRQEKNTMDEDEVVTNPSPKGKPVKESKDPGAAAPMDAATIFTDHPEVVEQILSMKEAKEAAIAAEKRKLEEADLARARKIIAEQEAKLRNALGDQSGTADLPTVVAELVEEKQRLAQEAAARQVKEYVEKACDAKALNYPAELATELAERIISRKPATVEEAKAIMVEERKLTDKTLAWFRTKMKGFNGVSVLGPVLENETGVPEYARAAFEIREALVRRNQIKARDLKKAPIAPSEIFAMQYLEAMDNKFKSKLMEEAKRFEEAELTSDLNLPYSVARVIMMEAFPLLISPNIFDWDMITTNPTSVFYESAYSAESGTTVAVTDEAVNLAALDTWYSLSNKMIRPGTTVLTSNDGLTTYVFGTDYVIDFIDGRILFPTDGALSAATAYKLDYTYDKVRTGENTVVQKAKATLASVTLQVYANALATEISREAVVFSRSQLGWDATTQTLALLVRELARRTDAGLLGTALAYSMSVANNSGGTWNSATDSMQTLVNKLVAAKSKVQNRNYQPSFIVLATTHANRLAAEYDKFTAAGATPGFFLNNQEGFLGQIGDLNVFHSTQFLEGFALVGNRQIIMQRVFQPMQLMGPYPSYDGDGNIKRNEQWIAEEFSGHVAPIKSKAAYISIT